MKKIILSLVLTLLVATTAAQAQNQDQYVELLRQDLRTMKTAIVTQGMAMTKAEGDAFWPVYREYETELAGIWDKRLALIQSYADTYEAMDEKTADDIMMQSLKLRSEREKLHANYYKKMKKEVGAILAARFMQIDGVLANLISLQISLELPLVIETAPAATEGE
ncbi:hypothetical protein DRQ53_04005 [bacterium]|nr:MAG: hypothetical protein DRQ53_04005 [bacterium]